MALELLEGLVRAGSAGGNDVIRFTGEAALRLWDAVIAWTEFPHLYELQRPKTPDDGRLITETFRPYLEARDWVSINRGEVINFETRS